MVLDVSGKSREDGAEVIQWPGKEGATNQQWNMTDLGNGSWSIRPVHSDKSLDVYGWSNEEGEERGAIKQWTFGYGANQQWTLSSANNGTFKISSAYSKLLMTVGNSNKGATIYQHSDDSSAFQHWYFNPVDGNCSNPTFSGSNKVLIGGLLSDETAAAAPFDVRYAYVHSKPAASSTYYTDSICSDAAVESGWWGCWPGNTTPPGYYVTWWNEQVTKATWQGVSRPQIFFWTWYSLRDLGDLAGFGDGPGEVAAINQRDLLTQYMNDYRFFLQKIGNAHNMIDLEPDFWGYVKSLGNPHQIPAQVTAANPTDCAAQENSAAGLARCLISMARKYAPNTGIGFHASCFDYQTDPEGCRQFLKDITTGADFMVGDVADRDAGWYATKKNNNGYWWDEQKGADALAFYKSLTETVGKPMVLWQIPVGNWSQNNTYQHYQDDKVDYFFSHMDQVADAHIVALLFGAGSDQTTSPETDGGNLIWKTINYWKSGGTPIR
ncbi:hypothetical Protein YC6258_03529 [Gynuella sunshinyii YC6258]|uniref:Ricin B lectin domain-containing protein n=1 Tax=Gynuella sunshinyii YC6258 TaxID=1445510 RepID=A0A0C5V827_9GAMM|nr:hypothetical Protein YC6258_03529 [Gynuella sunshinyii YC6258]